MSVSIEREFATSISLETIIDDFKLSQRIMYLFKVF
jgi:hypothetical protein